MFSWCNGAVRIYRHLHKADMILAYWHYYL